MKKILFAVIMLFVVPIYALAEENYFYLDTPLDGIYTTMDKIDKIASNSVKPIRKVGSNELMYCVTPGFAINPDVSYAKITNKPWEKLGISKEKYEKIQMISYYGYQYENHNDLKWIGVTKYLIWQEVLPSGWSLYLTETLRGPKTNTFDSMINEVNNLIAEYHKNPNIEPNIKGNYKNTITINDTNNVLNNYTSNNPNVIIDNNTLIIKPSNSSFDFTLNYKTSGKNSELYVYDDAQWVISRGNPPKKALTYHVEIPKGDLQINKIIGNISDLSYNANIPLKNIKYRVFNDTYDKTFETDINGSINITSLNIDNYYIKEVSAPNDFIINPTLYQIKITENKINKINVYDNIKIGTININKEYLEINSNMYVPEENALFSIYDDKENLLVQKKTDDKGLVSFKLPLGYYLVSQKTGISDYSLIKDEEIELFDTIPINLYYKNNPIPTISDITDDPIEPPLDIIDEPNPTQPDNQIIDETIISNNTDDEIINNKEEKTLIQSPIEIDKIIATPVLKDKEIDNFVIEPIINEPLINNPEMHINPQTNDEIGKYLLILVSSIIMYYKLFLKKLKKKRGF